MDIRSPLYLAGQCGEVHPGGREDRCVGGTVGNVCGNQVVDTGKGISESNQAAIFRRFYREEEVHEQQGVALACIWPARS